MGATSLIRWHIENLPKDQLFFSRDFLNYGKRSAIDICLWKMVIELAIIRVARGVFLKAGSTRVFSLGEIAQAKGRSQNRVICEHGRDAARQWNFPYVANRNLTFFSTGRSSKFQDVRNRKVETIGTSSRRLALQGSAVGSAINALWWIGEKRCRTHHVKRVLRKFDVFELEKFDLSHSMMPGWLSNLVHSVRGDTKFEHQHSFGAKRKVIAGLS